MRWRKPNSCRECLDNPYGVRAREVASPSLQSCRPSNVLDLNALARIASATFLIAYMAIYVAHWLLAAETKGSRLLIAIGFLSMAVVLALFLWTTALEEPWSFGLILALIAGSWAIEYFLSRRPAAARQDPTIVTGAPGAHGAHCA